MRKSIAVFMILLILIILPAYAQNQASIKIFHRLLIFNQKQEMLVVKIKNRDLWVTPGIYQDDKILLQEGLNNNASEYGISISKPKLHAVFLLKSGVSNSLSVRNIFSVITKDEVSKMPVIIGEVKWLSVKEASELITFPHINTIIKQVTSYPNTVWGGSLTNYKDGENFKSKTLEEFYPLFEPKKEEKQKPKNK